MHAYRTHTCGELNETHAGQEVRLSGWAHRVRDHGGVLFIDLRDHYGVTQVLADPDSPAFAEVEKVRAEWCVRIDGVVKARASEAVNADLATGGIEVFIREIEVLGAADELPLQVFGEPTFPEDTRLRYRFLDLRRETLHRNIMLRSQVIRSLRRRMEDLGFTEFQTPILTASSPEGARDFLVPSRLHRGAFYALPQAPQQFKQLAMVAGFDRYFQIAPCFRDEDPRADRSPTEFYQLDVEMSFVEQDEVLGAMEAVIRGVFEEFAGGKLVTPAFPRLAHRDALSLYGSDKPDLRNPIRMRDVTEHFRGSGFKVFAGLLEKNPRAEIRAIPAPGGGGRAFCDRMNAWAQQAGQPGLGYIFFRESATGGVEGSGPIAKNIGPERTEAIRAALALSAGDAAFFCGGEAKSFTSFAGAARDRIGRELGLIQEDRFEFAWIVDFPIYEWDDEAKKWEFEHNPFSMPQGGLEALETQDPGEIQGWQYDLVCNGCELASGAIRNHQPELAYKAFEIAGYDRHHVDAHFGGLLSAFRYGAPPHGGMAAGVERMVMLLADQPAVREVIMFPMSQRAEDPMMGAPGRVRNEQLMELGLRLLPRE